VPWPPTSLETLAVRAGMSDDELRLLLIQEIERRRSRDPIVTQTSENGSTEECGSQRPDRPQTQ
jgi:hypothetical protein